MLIARLVAQLDCYPPERADETWAQLRQQGAYRERQITESTACVQQLRDLLGCAWPAVLSAAAEPFESTTWCAGLAVILDRCEAAPSRLTRLGLAGFETAVRRELARWGVSATAAHPGRDVHRADRPSRGPAQRPGALQRASWVLADWRHIKARKTEVETRMVALLDQLGLTELVTSIPGVSAVGAAAMLAEIGDPTRFDNARALVKHAGLCPRENASGTFTGQSRISRRGRPRLRLAAWRAVWGALPHNPVMAARYQHLTTRKANQLSDGQARAAIAAALLRWIYVITTRRVTWDAASAGADQLPAAA